MSGTQLSLFFFLAVAVVVVVAVVLLLLLLMVVSSWQCDMMDSMQVGQSQNIHVVYGIICF